jgi:nicotinamidase-related amidase
MAPFSPRNCTLLLLDYQQGKMPLIRTASPEGVARAAAALAKAARLMAIPTIFATSLENGAHGPLLPEVAAGLPEAELNRVARGGLANPWADPNLVAAVDATRRRNLIMAGVTTDACLVFAAVAAARQGYHVQAVVDASGSPFALSEELSRQRMAQAGVTLTTTHTLFAELSDDMGDAGGRELFEALLVELPPPSRRERRTPLVRRPPLGRK